MSSTKESVEIKLKVPWGHVAGKTWGSSEATRVLVVHGILDNAASFDRLIQLLPDNFYYVAIDLPGHGFSSLLPEGPPLDFSNYVFTIKLVLQNLKWDTCIYLGHSFGAHLGTVFSLAYPEVITKLIYLDGFLGEPVRTKDLGKYIRNSHDVTLEANNLKPSTLYSKEEFLFALKNKRFFPLTSSAAEALFTRATTKVGDLYKNNRDYRLKHILLPCFNVQQYIEVAKDMKIPTYIIVASPGRSGKHLVEKGLGSIVKNFGGKFTIRKVQGTHDVHNNNPEVVAPHVCEFLNDTGKSKL